MEKKKWILLSAAAVLIVALILGVLALLGVFGPAKVGLCLRQGNGSSRSDYHALLEEMLTDADYTVEKCVAGNDQAKQTQQVQALLEEGYRLFVIEPVMTTGTENLLQLLQQADAKAVFIDYQPENLEQYPDFSYVGFDTAEAGKLQAQLATEIPGADLNDDGVLSYVALDIAQNHIASQQRWESIQSHLSAQGTCLEVCDCGLEAQTVQQQCQKLLSTYGKDLEIVFCADDAQVAGVLAAVEDGGRKAGEDIYIIGTNATGQTENLVKQGKLTGTLAADTTLAATRVVQLLRSRGEVLYLDAYVAVAAENVNGDNA